jgi:hypothetical protein
MSVPPSEYHRKNRKPGAPTKTGHPKSQPQLSPESGKPR